MRPTPLVGFVLQNSEHVCTTLLQKTTEHADPGKDTYRQKYQIYCYTYNDTIRASPIAS